MSIIKVNEIQPTSGGLEIVGFRFLEKLLGDVRYRKDWTQNLPYASRDVVIFGDSVYRAVNDHVSGAQFDPSQWDLMDVNFSLAGAPAGTYTKVTVGSTGRISSGGDLAVGDIPELPGGKITSGIIHPDRLGTGSSEAESFLRRDGQWVTPEMFIGTVRQNFVVAANGETDFQLTNFTYSPMSGSIAVYLNGVRQEPVYAYTENSSTSIKFNTGLTKNDRISVIRAERYTSVVDPVIREQLQSSLGTQMIGHRDGILSETMDEILTKFDEVQETLGYATPTKIATGPTMLVGSNVINRGGFVGFDVDASHTTSLNIVGVVGGNTIPVEWSYDLETDTFTVINTHAGAVAVAVEFGFVQGDLSKAIITVNETVDFLDNWLSDTIAEISVVDDRATALETSVSTINDEITSINSDIDIIKDELTNSDITALEGRVTTIEGSVSLFNNSMEDIVGRTETIESSISTIGSEIDSINSALDDTSIVVDRVPSIELSIETIDGSIEAINSNIDGINITLNDTGGVVDRVEALETTSGDVNTAIGGLEDRVTTLEGASQTESGIGVWFRERIQDVTSSPEALTVVVSAGGVIRHTATESNVWNFDTQGLEPGYATSFTLMLNNGAIGNQQFNGVLWPNGTQPTLSANLDILVFLYDGTSIIGSHAATNVS